MKTSTLIYPAVLLLFLPALNACMRSEAELHDTTNEIINRSKPEIELSENETIQYLADLEKYKEKAMRDIEFNDQEIFRIRKALVKKGEVIPVETMDVLDQLDRQNLVMKIKMMDYTGDGIESWRAFKAEFGSDMKTLSNSINTLKSSYSVQ